MNHDAIIDPIVDKLERNIRPSTADRRDIIKILRDYQRIVKKIKRDRRAERKERAIAP